MDSDVKMKKKPVKQKRGILERIMMINSLRQHSSLDDEIVSELLEAAAYSGDERLFSMLENLLTIESIDNLINPDPFGKASAVGSETDQDGMDGIFIGNILSSKDR
jgi:hypothetical protein